MGVTPIFRKPPGWRRTSWLRRRLGEHMAIYVADFEGCFNDSCSEAPYNDTDEDNNDEQEDHGRSNPKIVE